MAVYFCIKVFIAINRERLFLGYSLQALLQTRGKVVTEDSYKQGFSDSAEVSSLAAGLFQGRISWWGCPTCTEQPVAPRQGPPCPCLPLLCQAGPGSVTQTLCGEISGCFQLAQSSIKKDSCTAFPSSTGVHQRHLIHTQAKDLQKIRKYSYQFRTDVKYTSEQLYLQVCNIWLFTFHLQ